MPWLHTGLLKIVCIVSYLQVLLPELVVPLAYVPWQSLLELVMDLQTSVIILLSFSLAATIKGEKIEEEGGKGRSANGSCGVTLSYNLCRPTCFAVYSHYEDKWKIIWKCRRGVR